jgi:AraC family transcriptional regulator
MRRSTLDAHRARIGAVCRHLAGNLDEPLDLGGAARIAGLSPRQLVRVFTRAQGETPRAHLRRLRLERAAQRLRKTDATILVIAVEAGFGSHEAFTRVFRQRFGQAPVEYRRAARGDAQPRARAPLWHLVATTALRPYVEQLPL